MASIKYLLKGELCIYINTAWETYKGLVNTCERTTKGLLQKMNQVLSPG